MKLKLSDKIRMWIMHPGMYEHQGWTLKNRWGNFKRRVMFYLVNKRKHEREMEIMRKNPQHPFHSMGGIPPETHSRDIGAPYSFRKWWADNQEEAIAKFAISNIRIARSLLKELKSKKHGKR